MHRVRNRLHLGLEQAAGVGIGDHHRSDIGAKPCPERGKVDAPLGRRGNVLDLVAGERRGCRVGAVRALGDEDDGAILAARVERRLDTQNSAQFAMRARLGAHRDAFHAGQRDQPVRQLVDDAERALDGVLRLERVDVGESRHPRDLLVEARIVLHRAAAEREQAQVDGVVLPAEPRVMAHRLCLAEAGDAHFGGPFEPAETRAMSGRIGEIDAGGLARSDLEDQRLFEHQRAVARAGGRRVAFDARHFGLPAAGVDLAHASASSSAEASASISSAVVVSVTATIRPFCRSALSA